MVICDQCNHIMAPEGITRHVKRVHGIKILPTASGKSQIASLLASKVHSMAGNLFTGNNNNNVSGMPSNSLSSNSAAAALPTEFSNRLSLSKMAPPGKSFSNNSNNCKSKRIFNFQNWPNCILWMFVDDEQLQLSHQQQSQSMSSTSLSINPGSIHSLNSVSASNASLSSSSNSNSPTSSLKASSTSGSSSGRKNHRKVLPIKYREYDPEKHCGVLTIGGMKPCTRSLTCKTHQISLRRNVDGRSKPFDLLLAEHRNNSKDGTSKSAKQQVRQSHSLWSVGLPTGNRTRAASLVDANTRCSFEINFYCIRGISKHEPSTVDRFILFNCVNLKYFDFMYSSSPLNICSYIRWIATIN